MILYINTEIRNYQTILNDTFVKIIKQRWREDFQK